MKTKRFILSTLLLIIATMFNAVFAQSAEEAAKYGQLQEIQVPKAGKLGKFVKNADPNVTALKISGELNEKDLVVLFSLPNVAYLDLQEAKVVATSYKFKDNFGNMTERFIGQNDLLLSCSDELKFLVLPHYVQKVALLKKPQHALDMLVADYRVKFIQPRRSPDSNDNRINIDINEIKIYTSNEGKSIEEYFASLSKEQYGEVSTDCKTLYLIGDGKYCNGSKLFPEEIVIQSTGERILNVYMGKDPIVDLSSYNRLLGAAFFMNDNIKKVYTGEKITEIPQLCFRYCRQLEFVDMPAVKTIKQFAFADCSSLTGVSMPSIAYVEKHAFLDASQLRGTIYTYKLPENRDVLDLSQFVGTGVSKIDLTEHAYAPDLVMPSDRTTPAYVKNYVEFIIPANSRKHRYDVGEWKNLHVIEQGTQDTYSFKLDSVGMLQNLITEDNALNIRKLTLRGVLDESDFEVIRACKNLKYLDLTNCFTFQSTKNAKADLASNIALLQLFSMASTYDREKKEQQYEHYEVSTETVQAARVRENFLKGLGVDDISNEDIEKMFGNGKVILREECWLPQYALNGLTKLEELILPTKLLKIENEKSLFYKDEDKMSLRRVQVSKELKYIGDKVFKNAYNLQEINFSDSLQYIGVSCFRKSGLTKVDLSKTKIKYWGDSAPKDATNMLFTDAFLGCPLQEFRSPIGAQYPEKWYNGSQILDWSSETVIYMNMPEPFCKSESFGTYKELHIPRGMKAAWRGYPNLIDDIDL